MNIVLNEKEYIEECLKSKEAIDRPLYVINLLARYYYHCKGFKKAKIAELLIKFLEERYPEFIYDRNGWIDRIETATHKARKFPLREIDGVWLTASELKTIESLHSKVLERLAFTMLCLAKLNNKRRNRTDGWINVKMRDIFKVARISDCKKMRNTRIRDLCDAGLVELPNQIDNPSFRVTFIDSNSDDVLFVSDFRELGYEYLKYKGENFIRCGECGILTRGNKNGTKRYCSNCVFVPLEIKQMACVDCGEHFIISAKNNHSKRCAYCQLTRRRELNRIRQQKRRHNIQSVTPTN